MPLLEKKFKPLVFLKLAEGCFQLDLDLPERLDDRGSVRAVAVLQRQRQVPGAAQGLRGEQDQGGRMVRIQLRSSQRPPRLRQRAAEIHSGGHLRIVWL